MRITNLHALSDVENVTGVNEYAGSRYSLIYQLEGLGCFSNFIILPD